MHIIRQRCSWQMDILVKVSCIIRIYTEDMAFSLVLPERFYEIHIIDITIYIRFQSDPLYILWSQFNGRCSSIFGPNKRADIHGLRLFQLYNAEDPVRILLKISGYGIRICDPFRVQQFLRRVIMYRSVFFIVIPLPSVRFFVSGHSFFVISIYPSSALTNTISPVSI